MKSTFGAGVGFGLVLLTLSAAALAEPCDSILAGLQQERHLTLVKQIEGKRMTHYQDGENVSLSVSCLMSKPNIVVNWNGLSPDQSFYDLVGRAGSLVSSRSAADIVKASKQCRQQAIKEIGETATVEQNGLAIECQAFARDGGGTTISVFAE